MIACSSCVAVSLIMSKRCRRRAAPSLIWPLALAFRLRLKIFGRAEKAGRPQSGHLVSKS